MRGYFDESGTHDSSPVTTVAGWVSDAKNWRKCLIEWQAALHEQHIKQFHAKEFNRFDPKFIERLVGIITKFAFFGVAGSIVTLAYNDLPEWVKKRIGGRYHFCFYVMMDMLHKRMRNTTHNDPLTFYFEINSGMGRIADNFRRDFSLNACFFGSKEQHPLLQTADFLVYEVNRWINEALIQGKNPREAIKHLARAKKVTFAYHDEETLAGWPDELEKDYRIKPKTT